MLRSSDRFFRPHQSPSSVYNCRTLNGIAIRSTNTRASQRSLVTHAIASKATHGTVSDSVGEPTPDSFSSVMSTSDSLNEVLLEGQWKYRGNENDRSQFRSMGIDNLTDVCHDIMTRTRQSIQLKRDEQRFSSIDFHRLATGIDVERDSLARAQIYDLVVIVHEAARVHASISQLIRIWREARPRLHENRLSTTSSSHPRISYELALRHLIVSPNDLLLQIALHVSLVTGCSRMDLCQLGERLGVRRHQFDVSSIKDSSRDFQEFIKVLGEHKQREHREHNPVDTTRLPFRPRKKRGLTGNVSGTKFPVGRSFSPCV